MPAFAVGRSQVILSWLARMKQEGSLPRNHPILLDSPMATKTLVMTAKGGRIIAMNKATGAVISEKRLGRGLGEASGAPMTYMDDGKQYIVVAVTGRDGGKLVALSLP